MCCSRNRLLDSSCLVPAGSSKLLKLTMPKELRVFPFKAEQASACKI